ncbi:membrane protein [Fulvitalea axinellae]|uniref:Membrane protein n=1 Tax=Fulvitalea axinellae TaxID=1182444 RepID=A0AAU9CET5_9BACT|nr:membrane protein [Fulvitalea axinellae]
MLKLTSRTLLLAVFALSATQLWAQGVKSPYSALGVGTVKRPGYANFDAMGGVGISGGSPLFINTVNPALLVNNRYTLFDIGMLYEKRTAENSDISQTNSDAQLTNLAISLPIKPGMWTIAAGLQPYSNVDNEVFGQTENPDKKYILDKFKRRGSGGINQVFLSTGVRLWKGLSVGVSGNYFFGTISNEEVLTPYDTRQDSDDPLERDKAIVFNTIGAWEDIYEYSKFSFDLGVAYDHKFSKTLYGHLGAVYRHYGDFNVDFAREVQTRPQSEDPDSPLYETISSSNSSYTAKIPSELGFGLSFSNPSRWMLGVDFTNSDWSKYTNEKNPYSEKDLTNSYRFAVGGYFIPDYRSFSYIKRMTFSAGAYYEETPIEIKGKQITDKGLTFGVQAPLVNPSAYARYFSSINTAFTFGTRGTTSDALIKENYFQISVGLTFGDDSWFRRRKYD